MQNSYQFTAGSYDREALSAFTLQKKKQIIVLVKPKLDFIKACKQLYLSLYLSQVQTLTKSQEAKMLQTIYFK